MKEKDKGEEKSKGFVDCFSSENLSIMFFDEKEENIVKDIKPIKGEWIFNT